MTTTNEKAADVDVQFLQAKIRGLENEVRGLRENLEDRFAMAALTGIYSLPPLCRPSPNETAATCYAQAALMVDEKVRRGNAALTGAEGVRVEGTVMQQEEA